jgi:serine protease Do
MKKYYSIIVFFLVLMCSNKASYGQDFDKKEFERTIQKGIEKAYAASVRIWGIDSLTQKQNSAQFSGVVVDAAGHILTAAHAISPGNRYKVIFPDGKEFTAQGLGKMGFEPKTGRPDAAMIRIIDQGTWPIAEMGWSHSLKLNEPCISIAYPTTLNQALPTVRVGRISDPSNRWEFVQSTCKMEPGDSGGPLFDYMGRVIAIHSRIDIAEEVNYEIPIDTYRKYWTALTVAKAYQAFPEKTDPFDLDPKEKEIKSFAALEDFKKQFTDFETDLKQTSLVVKSTLKGKPEQVLGTLFYLDGKKAGGQNKSRSFIISKSSLVGDNIAVYFGNRKLDVTVISRKKESDLILLQLKTELKTGIKLSSVKEEKTIQKADLGKFLISVLPNTANEISVLSSTVFDIPKKFSSGYFGASANFIEEKIILTRINPNSPAAKAGLELKDQITGINNVSIKLPPEYGNEIMKYEPGDTISVQGIRDGTAYSLPVALTNLPQTSGHPAYHFAGGKSARSDGFNGVFAHDAILRPEQCGGPVFDQNGNFCGINIARFSRTSCLALFC